MRLQISLRLDNAGQYGIDYASKLNCQGLAIPACTKRLIHSETGAKGPSITTTIRLNISFCLRLQILLLNLLGKVAAKQARDEHACHQDLLFGHLF